MFIFIIFRTSNYSFLIIQEPLETSDKKKVKDDSGFAKPQYFNSIPMFLS